MDTGFTWMRRSIQGQLLKVQVSSVHPNKPEEEIYHEFIRGTEKNVWKYEVSAYFKPTTTIR